MSDAASADEADGSAELRRMLGQAREAADYLKTMAHESRLLLLCLLAEKERSVTELERCLELRQPAISQQLARLRAEGLVATRRDGKTIFYSLSDDRTRRLIGVIYELFCHR